MNDLLGGTHITVLAIGFRERSIRISGLLTTVRKMSQWLTTEDLERISEFAELPAYERTPEMLLPEAEENEP